MAGRLRNPARPTQSRFAGLRRGGAFEPGHGLRVRKRRMPRADDHKLKSHMLELDDIQHILLTRTPALTGRYEFLSFRTPASGRTWLSAISEKVQSAAEVLAPDNTEK